MAATVQLARTPHATHNHYHNHQSTLQQQRRSSTTKQRFFIEFSQCLVDFVIQLLPTVEELTVKEDVRKLLERLIRTIEPESRLLSFGSTANGFSLRNSDMDLCCLIDSDERRSASDLVTALGDLLGRETKFHVKPLPHARIPIVKLNLDPSPGLPFGIACDIGFENRLALENTRLLMCYAMIDPARLRTMVLFLKVWSKRRKINSPYQGTLSSYGFVLLVIYFLIHVKNPPVLPNLQQMSPMRPISKEETHLNGFNIWFFDDIELLRQRWQSSNTETVAELLIDFFKYYSRDFSYSTGVASIRAGLLKKEGKGWLSETDVGTARERNRFCIEDPFETDFNVARCVTKEGLFLIRGEFMRASRVLATRPERAIVALAQLCEERKDDEPVRVPSLSPFVPPRLVSPVISPQTSYPVGGSPRRSIADIQEEKTIPTALHSDQQHSIRQPRPGTPPEHVGPKREKWTSPPPPEAPTSDHSTVEGQMGLGLLLATSSTQARESLDSQSSNNSEILTDDDRSDFADEVHSSVAESTRPSSSSGSPASSSPRFTSAPTNLRTVLPVVTLAAPKPAIIAASKIDSLRRPMTSSNTSLSSSIPLEYALSPPQSGLSYSSQSQTVFYETAGPAQSFRITAGYPITGPCISTISSQYDQSPLYHVVPVSISSTASLPQHILMARKRNSTKNDVVWLDGTGSNTPTSSSTIYHSVPSPPPGSHSHSQSIATLKTSHTTPASSTPHSSTIVPSNQSSPISSDPSIPSRSRSPERTSTYTPITPRRSTSHDDASLLYDCTPDLTFSSSPPASVSTGSSNSWSPNSSSVSSNYATTPSLMSPPSPTQLNYRVQREGMNSLSAFVSSSKSRGMELLPASMIDGGRGEKFGGVMISRQKLGLR